MKKTLLVMVASVAAVLFTAFPSMASTHKPANSGCASGSFVIQNDASNLGIVTHSLGEDVSLENPSFLDCFKHISAGTWNGDPVYEWESLPTQECLYAGPITNYAVVGTTCQANDGYEEWDTAHTVGTCCEWWINRGVTDFRKNGNDYFMTGLGNSNGSHIAVYGPGYGNEAVWFVF